jgi:hypothetical protein
MPTLQPEETSAEKIEDIVEILEKLVLEVVINVLLKARQRNQLSAGQCRQWNCYRTDCDQRDYIPF